MIASRAASCQTNPAHDDVGQGLESLIRRMAELAKQQTVHHSPLLFLRLRSCSARTSRVTSRAKSAKPASFTVTG